MAEHDTAGAADGDHSFGKTYPFPKVFDDEIKIVNERRLADRGRVLQGQIRLEREDRDTADRAIQRPDQDATGRTVWRPNEDANVLGLALSGGGVRSASFCLGVLQALAKSNVLPKVDYLSTVSGGGYIGCSLTAALESGAGFPFASKLEENEPPALQQLRNYSNYLFPRGGRHNLLHNASVYARGLAVNAVLVASAVFAASALTLLYYPLHKYLPQFPFFLTAGLAVIVLAAGIAWGAFRSLRPLRRHPEYAGRWVNVVSFLILALFIVAFLELQPIILDAMHGAGTGNVATVVIKWINRLTVALAPLGAAVGYLSNKLGEYVKSTMQSPRWSGTIKAAVTKAAILIGGLILPLLIWMLFLNLTYLGLNLGGYASSMFKELKIDLLPNPVWPHLRTTLLFAVIALACFGISLLMQPNANSLHPLYRDRLKKAFLFVPESTLGADDLPAFTKQLSEIKALHGPYHLINAALNVEASKTANRRGRNADFFIFSPKFVGSKTTCYVYTQEMENVVSNFSFAAAMAVSGAAVSSNMGAQNIKPLTPTLALLNIRLGYWLRNPQRLVDARPHAEPVRLRERFHEFTRHRSFFANYYFFAEMFGLLSEKYKSVYLTDGGHIENLGIYELLRRRCRVIIAVDAEADPQMAFGSLNTLERYALIDMGIRIDLPWQQIANESLATSIGIDNLGAIAGSKNGCKPELCDVPKDPGPHCAVGEITYPCGRKGVLIYIKASLTGDENDTIIDYKKRYSAFPHETTLDQMFTEEQFEAYRALGFHAAFRFFDRSDNFAYPQDIPDGNLGSAISLLDQLFAHEDAAGEVARAPGPQLKKFAERLDAMKLAAKAPRTQPCGHSPKAQGDCAPA